MNEGHFTLFSIGGSRALEDHEKQLDSNSSTTPSSVVPFSTATTSTTGAGHLDKADSSLATNKLVVDRHHHSVDKGSTEDLVGGEAESQDQQTTATQSFSEDSSSFSALSSTDPLVPCHSPLQTSSPLLEQVVTTTMKLFGNNNKDGGDKPNQPLASKDQVAIDDDDISKDPEDNQSTQDYEEEDDSVALNGYSAASRFDETASLRGSYMAPPRPRADFAALEHDTDLEATQKLQHDDDDDDDGSIEVGYADGDVQDTVQKNLAAIQLEEERQQVKRHYRRLLLLSNLLFVLGSAIYMTMAVDDLRWAREARSIPVHVLQADDDQVWMEFRGQTTDAPVATTTQTPQTTIVTITTTTFTTDNATTPTTTVNTGRHAGGRRRKLSTYDDYAWSELSPELQAAANELGYDEYSWDNGIASHTEELFWSDLTEEQQEAAALMGYTQELWDGTSSGTDDAVPTATDDGTAATDDGAATTDDGPAAATDDGTAATDDGTPTTDDDTAGTDDAATTTNNNDPVAAQEEPILPYDDVLWAELDQIVVLSAQLLGYDEYRWDNDLPPALIVDTNPGWDDLTSQQKEAAQTLGYDADTWWFIRRNYDEFTVDVSSETVGNGAGANNNGDNDNDNSSNNGGSENGQGSGVALAQSTLPPGISVQWELFSWDELPENVQEAYRLLGWNQNLWDNSGSVDTDDLWWRQLTPDQQQAALFLGYTEAMWDAASTSAPQGSGNEGAQSEAAAPGQSPPASSSSSQQVSIVWEELDWDDLPLDIQEAYMGLGYNKTIWNSEGSVPAEDMSWDELTLAQRAAAISIGYTQSAWDGTEVATTSGVDSGTDPTTAGNPTPGVSTVGGDSDGAKDGETIQPTSVAQQTESEPPDQEWYDYWWSELPPDVQDAYAALGYTQHAWDNGKVVATEDMPWQELSSEQQMAAESLGYTQETWDKVSHHAPISTSSEYVSEDDDYIFFVPSRQVWVSRYMILYFSAALCFVIVGAVDLWRERKLFHVCFIVGGLFGLVSAMLIERNRTASNITNLISVHLYLLEGLSIIKERLESRRQHYELEDEDEDEISVPDTSFLSGLWWIPTIQLSADFFFVVGAFMDAILSYLYFKESSDWNLALARVFGFSTLLWVACSILYLLITLVLFYGVFPCCLGQLRHPREVALVERACSRMTYVGPLPTFTARSSSDSLDR